MSRPFTNEVLGALARNASMDELTIILRKHKNLGLQKQKAYEALEVLRSKVDEETEDRVLEIMDVVSGFCGPRNRVWFENDRSKEE